MSVFLTEGSHINLSKLRKVMSLSVLSSWKGSWVMDKSVLKSLPEKVIRWHTEINYPYPTLNRQLSVKLGNEKAWQRIILSEKNISVPRTWFNRSEVVFPALARPQRHARGERFYLLLRKEDMSLISAMRTYYFSEWLEKELEYRVYVAGRKVIGGYSKPVKGKIKGNLSVTGDWGKMIMPEKQICELAIAATDALGMDFSGVDIVVADKPYVIEVNTAPIFIKTEVAEIFKPYFKLWR